MKTTPLAILPSDSTIQKKTLVNLNMSIPQVEKQNQQWQSRVGKGENSYQ